MTSRKRAPRVDSIPAVAQVDPVVVPSVAPIQAVATFGMTGETPVVASVETKPDPAPTEEKKPYVDPGEELKREAQAVAKLVETLKDMGVTCTDAISASIESETNFNEMLEARIRAEGEIDAMAAGLTAYIATLTERVANLKKAKEAIRAVMKVALINAKRETVPTAYGTVYTISGKFSLWVKSEAMIPANYYTQTLDKTKLTDALKARKAALEAVNKITDDGERAEARKVFMETYPTIEGAELVQGDTSLGIRRK